MLELREDCSPGDKVGRFGPGWGEMIGGPRGGCSKSDRCEGHCRSGVSQAWQLIAFVG